VQSHSKCATVNFTKYKRSNTMEQQHSTLKPHTTNCCPKVEKITESLEKKTLQGRALNFDEKKTSQGH
jgi:hypothetical protein